MQPPPSFLAPYPAANARNSLLIEFTPRSGGGPAIGPRADGYSLAGVRAVTTVTVAAAGGR